MSKMKEKENRKNIYKQVEKQIEWEDQDTVQPRLSEHFCSVPTSSDNRGCTVIGNEEKIEISKKKYQ